MRLRVREPPEMSRQIKVILVVTTLAAVVHLQPLAPQHGAGRLPHPQPHRVRPRPRPAGASKSILSKVKSSVLGLGGQIKCAAEDLYAKQQLSDKRYIRQQLDCVLNRGPCDENGALIRRMAPDVLRGLCPHPCDECKRRKIRKAMALISRKFPLEWSEITRQYGR